jgi:folate-dependent phosphoribosylglycinamide formyltransferase PurN
MPFERIVLLAGKWDTTPIVYHFLQKNFHVDKVIIEKAVPRKEFLKKRIKKLGWLNVAGQVLFQLIIVRPLTILSRRRIEEIKKDYQLSDDFVSQNVIENVSSVNDDRCLQLLRKVNPDLVVVHGTRIISKKILQGVSARFINIHAGITPRYRGSHGAYWALANGDQENCGVTVHLVDAGIDTGNILAQGAIPYTSKDNFVTYPYLQLAEGMGLLKQSIEKLERGERPAVKNDLNSGLWHHPTLWAYLWKWISKGVK